MYDHIGQVSESTFLWCDNSLLPFWFRKKKTQIKLQFTFFLKANNHTCVTHREYKKPDLNPQLCWFMGYQLYTISSEQMYIGLFTFGWNVLYFVKSSYLCKGFVHKKKQY